MPDSILNKIENIIRIRLEILELGDVAICAKILSDNFTKGRASLSGNYLDDPKMRAAYLAHFFLTNAGKVIHCLRAGSPLTACGDDNLRVLDIGSGPGSSAVAASAFFAEHFPDAKVEILCVDASHEALREAETIFSALGNKNHTLKTKECEISSKNLQECIEGRFNIIIAANFLNELGDWDNAFHISKQLISNHLSAGGAFIVIDPALKETTRPLMELRDKLAAENIAWVAAPCLHQQNCPMLAANERDWCHFYIEWHRPELIRKMDELVGTDHKYLKLAYLIFSHRPSTIDHRPPLWRVVSSSLVSKGKIELVLCGENGELNKVMRQNKNSSDANADFNKTKRGDIVSCESKAKIGREDSFEIVCPYTVKWPEGTSPERRLRAPRSKPRYSGARSRRRASGV